MPSGPSGKHRSITGDELIEQRRVLVAAATGLPYRLHPDEPPPLGALAALGRAMGVDRRRAADWWSGARKMPVVPVPENTFENS